MRPFPDIAGPAEQLNVVSDVLTALHQRRDVVGVIALPKLLQAVDTLPALQLEQAAYRSAWQAPSFPARP
jgi:hypothetical protein